MPHQPTIAAYDQYDEAYDQAVIDFWKHFPATTFQAFCQALPTGGTHVLNLGSGSGRDALILRDQGLVVTCLDASRKMVERTRALGFESHHADFTHLPFPERSFEGVWAYTSLIHVPPAEATAVIRTLASLLRPGGTFLVGVILGDKSGLVEHKTMPGATRYFKYYTQAELTKMITAIGFSLRYEEAYRPRNSTYLSQIYTLD